MCPDGSLCKSTLIHGAGGNRRASQLRNYPGRLAPAQAGAAFLAVDGYGCSGGGLYNCSSVATAVWLLFGLGFCSMSAYILMITIARHASGLSLGRRMGLIVGGTWGLANLILMALVPLAGHYGTNFILKFMPLGYLFSGAFGLYIMRRNQNSEFRNEMPKHLSSG
jgi:hypothetical protein